MICRAKEKRKRSAEIITHLNKVSVEIKTMK